MNKTLSLVAGQARAALRGDAGTAVQMIRGVSGSALLKLFNTGATFLTAIVLARVLGAERYGVYAYAISWVTLLGVFAKAGIDQVIVRNVAVYRQHDDWAHIRGMLRFGFLLVSVAGLLCALAAAGIAWLLHHDALAMRSALWLACLLLPLQAMAVPLGATQQGLGQVVYAQLPSLLVTPLLFLLAVVTAYLLAGDTLSVNQVIIDRIGAILLGLAAALLLLRVGLRKAGRPQPLPKPAYQSRAWFSSAVPLLLMGSMFMINANADILMLGSLIGPKAAGIYKVATRGAELLTFSLAIVSTSLGPHIARLHTAGQHDRLQLEIRRWAWVAFAPTACLAAVFLVKGTLFLRLFGSEFSGSDATAALAILAAGQLFHVAAGPVGLLLVMTGFERQAALSMAMGTALNIALNVTFIPWFGIAGAAMATALSTTLLTVLLIGFSLRRLDINPTIFYGLIGDHHMARKPK